MINFSKRNFYNPNDSYRGLFWGLLSYFGLSLVFMTIALVFNPNIIESVNFALILSGIGVFGIGISVVAYSNIARVDFVSATKLSVKPNIKITIISLFTVIGLILFILPLADFLEKWFISLGYQPSNLEIGTDLSGILLAFFIASVLPAFCEELLMRGIISNGMSRYGIIPASLFSATVFMLFHMSPSQTIYQFALGFVMSYFMLRSGSLWTSIIMHFFNNVIALCLGTLVSETTYVTVFNTFWYIPCILGAIIVAVTMWLLITKTTNYFDKDAELHGTLGEKTVVVFTPEENKIFDEDFVKTASNIKADTQTINVTPNSLQRVSLGAKLTCALSIAFCVIMWIMTFLGIA